MTAVPSKGKWIPGTRDVPSRNSYSCDCCDRHFTKRTYLDKHLTTELHFKRAAQFRNFSDFGDGDILPYEPRRSCRNRTGTSYGDTDESVKSRAGETSATARSQAEVGSEVVDKSNSTHTRCPTCYSKVVKKQMGKHLISHFHCQRTRNSRRVNHTESTLILDHIHEIIFESPYQCATCKFYFTQKEQLLTHVREKHILQDEVSSSERASKWNCSACSRTKFAADGQKLLEHLQSSSHKIVESAIAKSIPIIIRQITPQTCPVTECSKMFILNRELVSHIHTHHGPEFLPQHGLPSPSDRSELINDEGVGEVNGRSDISHEGSNDSEEVSPIDLISPDTTRPDKGSDNDIQTSPPRRKIKQRNQRTRKVLVSNIKTKKSKLKGLETPNLVLDHQYSSKELQNTSKRSGLHCSCPCCDYSTHKKSHFTRHLQIHEGESRRKDFHCPECSASFFEKDALTNHRKIHTGKTVKCPVLSCTFAGRNNSELKSHSVVHNPPGSYPCKLCEYSTKSKRHLVRHQLLVHKTSAAADGSARTSFSCSKCKFNASTANGLKRHSLQHTEETPYQCPYCDFKSRNIENLRTHVLKRQLHAGRSLYCCSICAEEGKSSRKSVYETNHFIDFRRHIERDHSNHPCGKSQKGIFVVAGIQKQDDSSVTSSTMKLKVGSGHCSRKKGKRRKSEKEKRDADFPDSADASATLTTAELEQTLDNPVQEVIQLDENADFEMDDAIFISIDPYPFMNSLNKSYEICNYGLNHSHYVLLEQPTELSAGF